MTVTEHAYLVAGTLWPQETLIFKFVFLSGIVTVSYSAVCQGLLKV